MIKMFTRVMLGSVLFLIALSAASNIIALIFFKLFLCVSRSVGTKAVSAICF